MDALTYSSCLHCGNALPSARSNGYCCAGCKAVHQLLTRSGLLRYYDLRGAEIEPARDVQSGRRDHKWLEPTALSLAAGSGGREISVKLQGLRCAACVWLIQELFARKPDALRIVVNPGRGSAELCVGPQFPLMDFVADLESFGYLVGEAGQRGDAADREEAGSDDLLLRTAVCIALGGNAMMFAAAIYLGLHEGALYRLLHTLNFACATLAVLIGGPTFARSAWQAVKQRILHLDLPITVGIALTYGAAVWSFVSGDMRAAYYDSLATFIGLMLLGRWLKERIVLRNRRQLLGESGADNVWVRRIAHERVELVRAPELRAGDDLLVPAGDLVPIACELRSDSALCSLDWITGESEPALYASGNIVPAGAFNAGRSPLHLRAQTDFAASTLADLLARTRSKDVAAPGRFQWFSGAYVLGVLLAAFGGFAFWALRTGDVVRGLEVATAICVVTCPCAIGIASPLAYDLVLAGLRRAGLFVRTQSFLDRALFVRRVVFDKTGTLTTGRLSLRDDSPLQNLAPRERDVLYTLVSGSAHPKSFALARALSQTSARHLTGTNVEETPGSGLQASVDGHAYRLGHKAWACTDGAQRELGDDLIFSVDGRQLCVLATREALRPDVKSEIDQLTRAGYETWILSGDEQGRVHALARELAITDEHALGGFAPAGKAEWIAAHDRNDLLMVGDGINDSLAVEQAFVSGTPSIDRAFMPWRTDFYFVTPGLAPIGLALRAARKLAHVVRGNQIFAVTYNVVTVAVAALGLMRPWMAAVLMPLSSIAVLSATSLSLSARSRLWTS